MDESWAGRARVLIDFSSIINLSHNVFGKTATHIDDITSVSTSIQIVIKSPAETITFGDVEHVVDTVSANIKTSALPSLKNKDRIIIDGVTHYVVGSPMLDSQKLLWTAKLSK